MSTTYWMPAISEPWRRSRRTRKGGAISALTRPVTIGGTGVFGCLKTRLIVPSNYLAAEAANRAVRGEAGHNPSARVDQGWLSTHCPED